MLEQKNGSEFNAQLADLKCEKKKLVAFMFLSQTRFHDPVLFHICVLTSYAAESTSYMVVKWQQDLA